jgi:hypothetical protein
MISAFTYTGTLMRLFFEALWSINGKQVKGGR